MMTTFPFNFSASGAGGGMAIGGVVTGASVDGVFFGGVGGILSQDSTNFKRTAAQLFFKTTTEDDLDGAFRLEFAGFNGSYYTTGLTIRSTNASAYYPYHISLENAAYGQHTRITQSVIFNIFSGIISSSEVNIGDLSSNRAIRFATSVIYGAPDMGSRAKFYTYYATTRGIDIVLEASQTADAFQVRASDDSTVLGGRNAAGESFQTLRTPASASATGVQGTIVWDANYIYICTATNTWKRVAIATW